MFITGVTLQHSRVTLYDFIIPYSLATIWYLTTVVWNVFKIFLKKEDTYKVLPCCVLEKKSAFWFSENIRGIFWTIIGQFYRLRKFHKQRMSMTKILLSTNSWAMPCWGWLTPFLLHVTSGLGIPPTLHVNSTLSPSDVSCDWGSSFSQYGEAFR